MVLALCGECLRENPGLALDYERDVLQGVLAEEDGSIWLRRRGRRGHGEVVSPYEEDAALWRGLQSGGCPEVAGAGRQPTAPHPMGYPTAWAFQDSTCVLLCD
jgi:hypothetical protein